MEVRHWPRGVIQKRPPIRIVPSDNEVLRILSTVREGKFFLYPGNDVGKYFLSGMRIQNPKMLEDLDLPLGCQVLVPEEDNTAFIDKCSKLIQLRIV